MSTWLNYICPPGVRVQRREVTRWGWVTPGGQVARLTIGPLAGRMAVRRDRRGMVALAVKLLILLLAGVGLAGLGRRLGGGAGGGGATGHR
jgi:hypothetical protein